jgi:hypothetical protein
MRSHYRHGWHHGQWRKGAGPLPFVVGFFVLAFLFWGGFKLFSWLIPLMIVFWIISSVCRHGGKRRWSEWEPQQWGDQKRKNDDKPKRGEDDVYYV